MLRRRFGISAAAAAVAMMAFGEAAHAATLAKSRFTADTENWKVVGDVGGGRVDPDFHPTGGHPGGYVSATDAATDGVMYWRAPAKFRGNKADAYGGTLSFHLAQSFGVSQFDDEDVILEGGGRTLIQNAASNPAEYPGWSEYAIPLKKPFWTDATGTPEPATRRDIKRTLRSIDDLRIRAEYINGPDTDYLDNVLLKTP